MIARVFKLGTISLLLLCILLLSFSKVFIVVSFYANQTDIANRYCINKNNQSLHCDGKCFLMRMLKKEAQREKDFHENFSKTPVMFCRHYFPLIVNKAYVPALRKDHHTLRNVIFRKFEVFNKLLRPPSSAIA
ncbi:MULTISPECIES: hypothetical protein [Sphingobacterium]|uniref:hypothetical protein n=1 Tax=Sphingobacterium TaxID=28453 RepID=UPI00257F2A8B|nr:MULTISPECIES: hypothetical protein [Sphingobacterium]